jgi:aconitase A
MLNLLKENLKQNDELLKLKYEVNKNNIETLALIINELYYLEVATNIELKVLMQEEDYGSLITKPKFLIKTKSHPKFWLKKDINWMVEGVLNEDKNSRPNMTDDFATFDYKKDLNWSDDILNLVNHLTIIMDGYDWSLFRNIGRLQGSNLFKSYQNESKKNTNEYVFLASFSKENYIKSLSLIAWNTNEEELKSIIINKEKERLEAELNINSGNKIKNKL